MKEFMLLFRQPNYLQYGQASPEKMQTLSKKWQEWSGGIAAQNKLVSHGPRLALEGKVLKPAGVITDGPFMEIREMLGSFIIIRAENLEDATTLAHGCPAIDEGGSVEIRPLFYGGQQ
ncbi:MAG: YciI family protein [Flavisolibacter sp.]